MTQISIHYHGNDVPCFAFIIDNSFRQNNNARLSFPTAGIKRHRVDFVVVNVADCGDGQMSGQMFNGSLHEAGPFRKVEHVNLLWIHDTLAITYGLNDR